MSKFNIRVAFQSAVAHELISNEGRGLGGAGVQAVSKRCRA